MQAKQLAKSTGYNESKEEAKHPGAALGLIMGIYPTVLFVGMLLAMAYLGFRSANPVAAPTEQSSEARGNLDETVPPEINASKHGTQ